MTICVVCKGELDDDVKVYLDGYYIRKHHIKVGRARFLHSRYPLDFAHPACVEHPGDLSEKAYKEWAAFTLAKQASEIQDLRRALKRIEHALLDSPEDVSCRAQGRARARAAQPHGREKDNGLTTVHD